ncbi:unnamed protein product [Mytilus edulis]|uniref:Uncharacterized protein n=1 Tax=Mytilus edulis TaxID=6550 RepID=A0A8S3Q1B9_MYTED|nr:unnamed protein product [Mytilus edulis]
MYKQLMGKEKELADMLKEKVPVYDIPSNFTLKDFADQVKSNYLTKALKLYFNNGNNKRAAWDYITLTQSAMELDGCKSKPAFVRDYCSQGMRCRKSKEKRRKLKKIAKSKLFNMKEKLQRLSKLVEKTKSVHIPNLDEESEDAITTNGQRRSCRAPTTIIVELSTKQTAVCDSLATLLSEEHAVSFLVSYQTLERDLYELTGEILEDTEPNAIKPPDLVAFLDEIVYSIDEYKRGR